MPPNKSKSAPATKSAIDAFFRAAGELKIAAIVVDKEFRILAANNLAAKIWLTSAAELPEQSLPDVVASATPALYAGKAPPVSGIITVRGAEKESSTWQYNRTALGAGRFGLLLFEQYAAKNSDTHAQNKLKLLFDILPVGVSVLNREGDIIDVNTALTKILRLSGDEIRSGKVRARKYFDAGMKALSADNFPSAIVRKNMGAMRDFEMASITDAGEMIWVSVSATYAPELDETVIITRNITDEKDAVSRVKQREEFFHTILDALPGMVAYWDKKLICKYLNQQHLSWFGRPPDKLIGMHMSDLMSAKLFSQNRPFVEGALGGKMQVFERRLTRADGTTLWTSTRYVPHKTENGVEGFFALLTDITGQVEARLVAERASKSKSAFFAMLSHELRTPLNGIIGTTDLLSGTSLSEEQTKFIDMIRKSSDFLFKHIESLLQHARLEAEREFATASEVRMQKLIEHVVATARTANPKKQHLLRIAEFATDFPAIVLLDENKLSQVLMNLIGNAVKFTSFGSIVVGCKVIARIRDAVRLEFTVQDTGIGIPPRELAHIFEPYHQVSASTGKSKEGLGLGLSISEKLVHVMGGQIRVESAVNQGSRFTVELQARLGDVTAEKVARPSGLRSDIPEIAAEFPARILVADDNPLNIMLLEHMLHKLGYTPTTVENGRQAFMQTTRNKFDIVFMDVHMPEVDGIAATKAIRNSRASGDPVIIAVTANAAEENRNDCLEAGMDDFLSKPIRLQDIVGLLQKWAPRGGRSLRN